MVLQLLYWFFLAACSAYALAKGGAPERIAIGIAVIASVVSVIALSSMATRFDGVEAGVFLVDLVTLVAFFLLALHADRFWPLWITGFQLIGVATHLAMLLSPDVVPQVYSFILGLWAYPILALIVIGAARHRKRLKPYGVDTRP
jgi:hypothetical protein